MDGIFVNRKYKDSLFRMIFGENKDYALSLYNAINGTSYNNPEELILYTIEDAVYMGIKNDVSFILDEQLNLYEHQSTVNPNMPIRGFLYFAKQYEKYLAGNRDYLFGRKLIKLPAPQYVIFYNGISDYPEYSELRLSDAFVKKIDDPAVEIIAKVYNINADKNKDLHDACKALSDYSKFVKYTQEGDPLDSLEERITKAVDRAIEENLLDGFFLKHKAEVIGMLLTEWDENAYHEYLKAEGIAEGIAEGGKNRQAEILNILEKHNVSAEVIAEIKQLSPEN